MYVIAAVLTSLALKVAAQGGCDPTSNCQLPNCRCFLDSKVPGGLNLTDVPQLVVLSMDYVLNEEYEPLYNQIFSVSNPNGCEIRGTFFIQDKGSNLGLVKRYADGGFEIGINSIDGTVPTSEGDMVTMMKSKNLYLSLKSFDSLRAGTLIFTYIRVHAIPYQELSKTLLTVTSLIQFCLQFIIYNFVEYNLQENQNKHKMLKISIFSEF